GEPDVDVAAADELPQVLSLVVRVDPRHQREVGVVGHRPADHLAHPAGGPEHADPGHLDADPMCAAIGWASASPLPSWRAFRKALAPKGPTTARAIGRLNTWAAAAAASASVTESTRRRTSSTERISPWLISDFPIRLILPDVSS